MSPEHLPIIRSEGTANSPETLDEALAAMLLAQAGQEPHDRELADWISDIQEDVSGSTEGIKAAFLRITEPISMEEYGLIEEEPASALDKWREVLHVSRYRAHLSRRLEQVRSDPRFWTIHIETQARQLQWQHITAQELSSQEDRAAIGNAIKDVRNDSSRLDYQERAARLRATKMPFQPLSLEDIFSGVTEDYDEMVYQEQLHTVAEERKQLVERIEQHVAMLKEVHPNDLFQAYVDYVLSPEESNIVHDAMVRAIYNMERVLGIPYYDHKFPRFREWADRAGRSNSVEDLRTEYIFDSLPRIFLPYKLPAGIGDIDSVYRLIDQVVLIAICGLRTPGERSRLDPKRVIPQDPAASL